MSIDLYLPNYKENNFFFIIIICLRGTWMGIIVSNAGLISKRQSNYKIISVDFVSTVVMTI